jgi:hypothetical protein
MKLEFSQQIFKKYSDIEFHGNPPSGKRVVPCRRTEGHDEPQSRFSRFCEIALKKVMGGAVYMPMLRVQRQKTIVLMALA